MLKWWMRLFWFLSSYTPLWIVLSITNFPTILIEGKDEKIDGSIIAVVIFLAITALSNLIIFTYLFKKQKVSGETIETKDPVAISELSKEYIVTYAISLIGFNLHDTRQAISFVFLITFFAFLYVKYNDITYNPMLDCFGFRLFKTTVIYTKKPKNSFGEYPYRQDITLITRERKKDLDLSPIQISTIGDDIFIHVSSQQQEH